MPDLKARTNTFHTLWGVMIGAPSAVPRRAVVLSTRTLVNRRLRLWPESDDQLGLVAEPQRLRRGDTAVGDRLPGSPWPITPLPAGRSYPNQTSASGVRSAILA